MTLQQPPSLNGGLPQKRVQWIMTSCTCHSFLAPTVEFLWLSCNHNNYDIQNYDIVCGPYGHATQYTNPDYSVVVRIWRTILAWNQVRFEGQSIHEIVQGFVTNAAPPPSTFDGQAIDLRLECAGPNCLSQLESLHSDQPSCQSLIEIENTHIPIPVAFQAIWLIFLGLFVVVSVLILCHRQRLWKKSLKDRSEHVLDNSVPEAAADTSRHAYSVLRLNGIHVTTTKDQKKLLHDVGIELQAGTITGLLGRSGSGKSTLLKALSQNYQPNLNINMDHKGKRQLSSMTKAYLCQEDPVVAFGNLYPADYLTITAQLYDADPCKTQELCGFTRELLSRGGQQCPETERQVLNPFLDTRIGNLSGGQRRILSIAATFLCEPQLLFLDEPCSGLDTISSLQVMSALHSFTRLRQCAALLTFHQPSQDILSHFKKVVVLDAGRVVLDQTVVNPQRTEHLVDMCLLHSHENSQRAAILERSNRSLLFTVGDTSDEEPIPEMPGMLRNVSSGGYSSGGLSSGGFSRLSSRRLIIQPMDDITEAGEETERGEDIPEQRPPEDSPSTIKQSQNDATKQHPQLTTNVFPLKNLLLDILRQVRPLAQRIHCQYNYDVAEVFTLFTAFCILAAVLVADDGSHLQIVLATAAMLTVPSFLFTHKIFAYNELFLSHRFELDDKRISPLSFQMATAFFTFPVPLVSVLLAMLAAYAILDWSFSTFAVQFLFVGLYLLIAMQFGRMLCVLFCGRFGAVMKVYTTVLLINAVFSGVFVSPNSFPDGLHFLFYISITFWALSGAVLNIFNDDNYQLNRRCFDLFSCFLNDGNVAGRVIGFSPISDSYRAMGILSCVFAGLVVLESLLLCVRCRGMLSLLRPLQSSRKQTLGAPANESTSAFNRSDRAIETDATAYAVDK